MTDEEFEKRLHQEIVLAVEDAVSTFKIPDGKQHIADRVLKTIKAAPKLAQIVLSAYQHVSHGGPTRREVEAVLKEAGIL